jgi:hypothetical protein
MSRLMCVSKSELSQDRTRSHEGQCCQTVYFQAKNANLSKFWSVNFMEILSTLLPFGIFCGEFGIFCGNLVYFVVIWYICGHLVYFVVILA